MIGQGSKHLSHAKAMAACVTEAGLAVLHGDLERCAGISKAGVRGALLQTGENADATIGDHNFECIRRRRIDDKAGFSPTTVQGHIVLQFAHGSDDSRREGTRKTDTTTGLFGATAPKRPTIGSVPVFGKPAKREHAVPRLIAVARNRSIDDCLFNGNCERRGKFHPCEGGGIGVSRKQHFDQRSRQSRAIHPNGSKLCECARLGGPQEIVCPGVVASEFSCLSLRLAHEQRLRAGIRSIRRQRTVILGLESVGGRQTSRAGRLSDARLDNLGPAQTASACKPAEKVKLSPCLSNV
jgi:hypothetical protein